MIAEAHLAFGRQLMNGKKNHEAKRNGRARKHAQIYTTTASISAVD